MSDTIAGDTGSPAPLAWSLVIPVKLLARAKTRLSAAAGVHRETLALSVAADTVTAALGCDRVRSVIVVTDDPRAATELAALGARVVPDLPDAGLNPALTYGASVAREADPGAGVGALSADLPALRPAELRRALDAAAASPRAFVADLPGAGTTLYTARPGAAFGPEFGRGSARLHRAQGAMEILLDGIESVRRDVDTPADLLAALALGAGPRTTAAAEPLRLGGLPLDEAGLDEAGLGRLGSVQATVRDFDADTRSGSVLLDDGTELGFDSAAFDAGGLRLLRFGQRVNLALDGGRISVITLATFPLPR